MDLAFWNLKMIPFPQKTHASLTRIHSFSNQMFGWGEAFSASIFPWSPGRARGNEWSWNVMKSVWIANICWQGKFWWFGYKQLTNIYTLSTPPHLQGVNSHVIWLLPKRSHDCTVFSFTLCGKNPQVVISFPSLPLRVSWSTRCGRVRRLDLSNKHNPL